MHARHLAQAGVVLMLLAPMGAIVRAEDDQTTDYVLKGIDEFVDQNYNAAIADFTRAIEIDPAFVPAYTNRAAVKYETGDYDGAIEDDTRAIELEPQNSMVYGLRATSENAQGNYAQAIADWQKEIELNPSAQTKTQPRIDEAQAKLNQGNAS